MLLASQVRGELHKERNQNHQFRSAAGATAWRLPSHPGQYLPDPQTLYPAN